jgi:23S rRNA (pseudouridine1915-N3)-methyltransferase
MRLHLVAVGRLKAGPERELFDLYRGRLDALGRRVAVGPLKVTEIAESRAARGEARQRDEAGRLLEAAQGADATLVLDARGKSMTSEAFAGWLAARRDGGVSTLALLVGGPDGHGEAALGAATLVLSLGSLTLPHGLARVVLAEQLYRAVTLIAGHPYHRG